MINIHKITFIFYKILSRNWTQGGTCEGRGARWMTNTWRRRMGDQWKKKPKRQSISPNTSNYILGEEEEEEVQAIIGGILKTYGKDAKHTSFHQCSAKESSF